METIIIRCYAHGYTEGLIESLLLYDDLPRSELIEKAVENVEEKLTHIYPNGMWKLVFPCKKDLKDLVHTVLDEFPF